MICLRLNYVVFCTEESEADRVREVMTSLRLALEDFCSKNGVTVVENDPPAAFGVVAEELKKEK